MSEVKRKKACCGYIVGGVFFKAFGVGIYLLLEHVFV